MRALVGATLAIAATLLAPSVAGAHVIHVRGGHFLGIVRKDQPASRLPALRAAPSTTAANNGAALRADPNDPYPLPSTYQSLIDRYLGDVASASHAAATDNVYGISNQYGAATTPASGSSHYSATFGHDLGTNGGSRDTDPFPADGPHGNSQGCDPAALTASQSAGGDPAYGWCVTDAQIQSEIERLIAAGGLPSDNGAVYMVFLPPGVDVCAGPGPQVSGARGNPCGDTDFCAYHSSVGTTSGPLYAVLPWANITGCQSGNHPNGDPADDTVDLASHEHIETITDPFGTSWLSAQGDEIGDLCVSPQGGAVFGSPLGGTPGSGSSPGTAYNQIISGDHYYLQDEFADLRSNGAPLASCQQRPGLSGDGLPSGATDPGPLLNPGAGPVLGQHTLYPIYWYPGATPSPPTASFAQSTSSARPGDAVAFDASASRDPQGQALSYGWDFGDGSTGAGATVSHAYNTPGDHLVTLTVRDASQYSGSATSAVHVFTPPTAAFTAPSTGLVAGQPISLDASSSGGPEAPITSYAWSFGDGTSATGAKATHAYATPGVYTVTLTVTDAHGATGTATQQLAVGPPPPAPLTASGAPKAIVSGGGILVDLGRRVTCPSRASCTVTVTLTTKVKTRASRGHRSRVRTYAIGTARIAVSGGRSAVLTVKLNAQGRALLPRLHRLVLSARVVVAGTGVAPSATTLRFAIRQPASARRRR